MKIIEEIALSNNLHILSTAPVHGGDINEAWCLQTETGKYFLKLNDAGRYPAMFQKEADGLHALRNTTGISVPQVINCGVAAQWQWLLLEWIEKGHAHANSMKAFGTALARMHKTPQPFFGWHTDNYIGSLVQTNEQMDNWAAFYTRCRIMPLIQQLFDGKSISVNVVRQAEHFCQQLDSIFPNEPPALLHGDLWAGNFMVDSNAAVAVFDPAVYCGHREMDLGMTKLFGGFSSDFYNGYLSAYPPEKNWLQRLPYTQLYPLLVHAVLFSGHYVQRVKEIISEF